MSKGRGKSSESSLKQWALGILGGLIVAVISGIAVYSYQSADTQKQANANATAQANSNSTAEARDEKRTATAVQIAVNANATTQALADKQATSAAQATANANATAQVRDAQAAANAEATAQANAVQATANAEATAQTSAAETAAAQATAMVVAQAATESAQATAAAATALVPPTYQIEVDTGNVPDAGAKTNVFISLHGTKGNLVNYQLTNPIYDAGNGVPFSDPGRRDVFEVSHTDLGDLDELEIWRDKADETNGWCMEKVIVTNKKTSQTWTFYYNGWFSTIRGDKSPYHYIYPDKPGYSCP